MTACTLAFRPLSAGVSNYESQNFPRNRHGNIDGRVDGIRVAGEQRPDTLPASRTPFLSRGEEQAEDYRRQDGAPEAEEAHTKLRTGARIVVNRRLRSGKPHVNLPQIQAAPGIVHGQRPGAGRS
ncbi:hypothetical protein SBA2_550001 [Acidobacteriia bacterium SbA2]|nr:hypothetical protein SBA2_550001 [Acidobacteriia bacterium SbA2]